MGRDDPAFVVVLLYLLLVAAISWSLAFAQRTPLEVICLYLYIALVDFLLLRGCAGVCWLVGVEQLPALARCAYLGVGGGSHAGATEYVEWLYAFDVHCNALLPVYLLLSLCAVPAAPGAITTGHPRLAC